MSKPPPRHRPSGRGRATARGIVERPPDTVKVGPAAGELTGLMAEVLEAIELGALVCDSNLDRVRFANREAAAVLAAFAGAGDRCPAAVREAIGARAARELPRDQFTPAVSVEAPGGERLFVRARRLGAKVTGALIVISRERVRRADIVELLHRHYGVSHRQGECAALVYQGLDNREVGARLGISGGRVAQYLVDVYAALEVKSRTALVSRLHDLMASR